VIQVIPEKAVKLKIVLWIVILMEIVSMESVGAIINGLVIIVKYLSVKIVATIEDNVRKANVYVWKVGKESFVNLGMLFMEKLKKVVLLFVKMGSMEYYVHKLLV